MKSRVQKILSHEKSRGLTVSNISPVWSAIFLRYELKTHH